MPVRNRNILILFLSVYIIVLAFTQLYPILDSEDSSISQIRRVRASQMNDHIFETGQRKMNTRHLKLENATNHNESCDHTLNESSECLKHANDCEVIHVAIVCAGYNSSRTVVTVLKSILFYRTKPLHFHFISDGTAMVILDRLLRSWDLYELKWSFYPTYTAQHYIDWIPNRHYSGQYGLMKLLLPEILPQHIDKTLVLDTDIIFTSDIVELWALFKTLQNKVIGLVENQSDWYIKSKIWKKHRPWPALGTGFNTGVMLMNLEMLRTIKWMDVWSRVTKRELKVQKATVLADQDIINAVLVENPDLMTVLPCYWNLQFSEHTKNEECYSKIKTPKIIHWNSPWKLKLKNKHMQSFLNMYYTFLNFDGSLLKRQLFTCSSTDTQNPITDNKENKTDDCVEFREHERVKFRIHIYYIEYAYEPVEWDVTLITQLSIDRLQMLHPLSMHWKGPISIALYLSDSECQEFFRYVMEHEPLRKRKDIGYHIVYKDTQSKYYPVNVLRNLALEQAKTEFVYMADIDFLPQFGLHDYLRQEVQKEHLRKQKKVLLIPAFETLRYKLKFPRNKSELLNLLNSGELYTFRYHVWHRGHAPTNYTKWRNATNAYAVKWDRDFEPYLVFKKNVPRYDERFIGFGWNKVSHIIHLDAEGYEFIVLPNAFMIHMPHSPSDDLAQFRTSPLYRRCLKLMKTEFLQEMEELYGNKALKYAQAEIESKESFQKTKEATAIAATQSTFKKWQIKRKRKHQTALSA